MPASRPHSGASTPIHNPRFTPRVQDAEDALREQTLGLVHFSDFRKRRAEALEQAQDGGREGPPTAASKKRTKLRPKRAILSFRSYGDDDDDDDDDEDEQGEADWASVGATPASPDSAPPDSAPPTDTEAAASATATATATASTASANEKEQKKKKQRLKPSTSVAFAAQAMTKSALHKEAQVKEQLRREFVQVQEAVKGTDFLLPFVFFAGKDRPGGVVRMKKGDAVWLFLERARKVGAQLAAKGDVGKRDWARIGVDDLMLVRQGLLIPHHATFHTFILNRHRGPSGPLFPYSAGPTPATPQHLLPCQPSRARAPDGAATRQPSATSSSSSSPPNPTSNLTTSTQRESQKHPAASPTIPDAELEGFEDEPALTKVVDRRWYEKNKHIYPASVWEEWDAGKDYSRGGRKDGLGNAFFYAN